jgi:hypothetical protein
MDWLTRMFAVRDLALGLGTLQALRAVETRAPHRGKNLQTWLVLAALCDAGDALGMARAIRAGQVRPLPAGFTATTAVGAAATGLASALNGPTIR